MERTDFQKVIDFNVQFDVIQGFNPEYTFRPDVAENSMKLIREEMREYARAVRDSDRLEQLDGLCDIKYVVLGLCARMGIDIDRISYNNKHWYKQVVYNDPVLSLSAVVANLDNAISSRTYSDITMSAYTLIHLTHKIGVDQGFNMSAAFNAVHENNMTKASPTEDIAQQTVLSFANHAVYKDVDYRRAPDGENWVIYDREQKKILKPLSYLAVDLREYL